MDATKNLKTFKSLISAVQLNNLLNDNAVKQSLKIFDCTYPSFKGYKVFQQLRIRGAKYLSLEKFRSNEIINSEMLSLGFPGKQEIFEFLKEHKIKKTDMIVLYDQQGTYNSPRAWFILKTFSVKNIHLLDGGLPVWMKNQFPIDDELIKESLSDSEDELKEEAEADKNNENDQDKSSFYSIDDLIFDEKALVKFEQIKKIVKKLEVDENESDVPQLIDTRVKQAFLNFSLPNATNIPFNMFLNEDNTFKSKEQIEEMLKELKIKTSGKEIINYCAIGMSACISDFALEEILGLKDVKLYSGSLEEYSSRI